MQRRQVLSLTAGMAFLFKHNQAKAAEKTYRIALVHPSRALTQMTKGGQIYFRGFFEELEKRGYVEGKNLSVSRFSAEGVADKYELISKEAVESNPDVIISSSDRIVLILSRLTSTIPILSFMTDPVAYRVASSISHPGGNVSGVMVNPSLDIWKKRVEYLKEIIPDTKQIFVLSARSLWESPAIASIREAIEQSGCTMVGPPVESPHREPQYQAAFSEAARTAQACIVSTSLENLSNKELVVRLSNEHRLASIYPVREYVDVGGLIAHDVDLPNLWIQLARQTSEALAGMSVAEMPFYQPFRLRLIINLKTADDIRVKIPAELLARADEVLD
ncbi:ABC transporter substrate-binding protein [Methylobacterium sp. CM6257]